MQNSNFSDDIDFAFSAYANAYYERQMKDSRFPKLMDFLKIEFPDIVGLVEDWGCGPGHWCKALDDRIPNLQYSLRDVSSGMLSKALTLLPKATVLQEDCRTSLPLPDSVSVLILAYIIPYLTEDEMKQVVEKAIKALNNKGVLILSYMSYSPYSAFAQKSSDGKFTMNMNYHDSTLVDKRLTDAGLVRVYQDVFPEPDHEDRMEIWTKPNR